MNFPCILLLCQGFTGRAPVCSGFNVYFRYIRESENGINALSFVIITYFSLLQALEGKLSETTDPDKKIMLEKQNKKALGAIEKLQKSSSLTDAIKEEVLADCKDTLSAWLDKQVTIPTLNFSFNYLGLKHT